MKRATVNRHGKAVGTTNRLSFLSMWFAGLILSVMLAGCSQPSLDQSANASGITETSAPSPTAVSPTPEPSPVANATPTVVAQVNDPAALNEFLAQFGDWNPAAVQTTDDRTLESGKVVVEGQTYQCTVSTDSKTLTYQQILAPGVDSGAIWPGALVQGQGVLDGKLAVIPVARAPMTLSVDLAIPDPNVTIDDPYSGSVRAAVSVLQRAADQRLGGIDVVPATMSYVREESFSFDQAMLSIGVSVNYAGPLAGAGLDASFATQRQVGAHTIIVKFFQPMYTIRMADDRIATPADLFAPAVSVQDLQQQESLGRLGLDNPPLLVTSVTYGRMMVFTMTSTEVDSAQRLMAAVSAVYGNFSGSAAIDKADLEILKSSRIDMKVFGGQQDSALEAIRSGDLSQFFTRAEAANAVPLSYQVRQLNGKPVTFSDATTFRAQRCNEQAAPKPVHTYVVRLSNIDDDAYVYVNGALVKRQKGGSVRLLINPRMGTGNNTLEIVLGNGGCFASSLNMAIDVDGVQKVTRGYYSSFATCGYQLDWKYTINKDTGVVKQVS